MKKENMFKRNVCFTFFEDYRLTAKDLEADFGKEVVADYYNAIIDYALYGNEPDLKGTLKYIWHTTKSTIDKSIERRSNGFTRENTKQTEIIKDYKKNHPDATQREIAEATGISIGKVNKVLKNNKDDNSNSNTITNSNTNTITNTTNEREREHNREHVSLDDLNKDIINLDEYKECKVQNNPINKTNKSYTNPDDVSIEKKKEVINLYEPGCKIYKIAKTVGLDYDIAKQIIDDYTKDPKNYFYVPPVIKSFIVYDEYNNKTTMDRETIAMSLLDFGEDKKKINKCLNGCYDDIIKCKENNEEEVKEFFKKEFKFIKDESVTEINLHDNDYEIDDEEVFG